MGISRSGGGASADASRGAALGAAHVTIVDLKRAAERLARCTDGVRRQAGRSRATDWAALQEAVAALIAAARRARSELLPGAAGARALGRLLREPEAPGGGRSAACGGGRRRGGADAAAGASREVWDLVHTCPLAAGALFQDPRLYNALLGALEAATAKGSAPRAAALADAAAGAGMVAGWSSAYEARRVRRGALRAGRGTEGDAAAAGGGRRAGDGRRGF